MTIVTRPRGHLNQDQRWKTFRFIRNYTKAKYCHKWTKGEIQLESHFVCQSWTVSESFPCVCPRGYFPMIPLCVQLVCYSTTCRTVVSLLMHQCNPVPRLDDPWRVPEPQFVIIAGHLRAKNRQREEEGGGARLAGRGFLLKSAQKRSEAPQTMTLLGNVDARYALSFSLLGWFCFYAYKFLPFVVPFWPRTGWGSSLCCWLGCDTARYGDDCASYCLASAGAALQPRERRRSSRCYTGFQVIRAAGLRLGSAPHVSPLLAVLTRDMQMKPL